jgi:hypothetical protein
MKKQFCIIYRTRVVADIPQRRHPFKQHQNKYKGMETPYEAIEL